MAEKTIIGKMSLYEVLTMIVPGTMIVFCIWLSDVTLWTQNLWRFNLPELNFLFDIAIGIILLALVYVAGMLNYLVIDGIWRITHLRNNSCMIKCVLKDKIGQKDYTNLTELVKEKNTDEKEICELSDDTVEDIYYEAYTYALKKNGRSNIPFLENQVAMFKGLIFPMTGIGVFLCPEGWNTVWMAIGIFMLILLLAICRQKKTITLVLEDYEYEKRIEQQ